MAAPIRRACAQACSRSEPDDPVCATPAGLATLLGTTIVSSMTARPSVLLAERQRRRCATA